MPTFISNAYRLMCADLVYRLFVRLLYPPTILLLWLLPWLLLLLLLLWLLLLLLLLLLLRLLLLLMCLLLMLLLLWLLLRLTLLLDFDRLACSEQVLGKFVDVGVAVPRAAKPINWKSGVLFRRHVSGCNVQGSSGKEALCKARRNGNMGVVQALLRHSMKEDRRRTRIELEHFAVFGFQ